MSARAAGQPLTWNVAGLLAEDAGATRDYDIAGVTIPLADPSRAVAELDVEGVTIPVVEETRLADPIEGRVRLRKTNRGIVAGADLRASLAVVCSRCLRPVEVAIAFRIDEEYLPVLDLVTGRPMPTGSEPDALRLSDHHELDLETPVREAILLAEPFAPLCRTDCPGLCAICGLSLEDGPHDHPDDDIDPRLEALRGFVPKDGA
ncbi:MAG: DUF177 domain-containing protein [Chloroflexi bacterium]|nr:DUF177 domain-containing protein [Chloroflexota bacterium]